MSTGDPREWLLPMLLRIPGLLVGITVHEFFHAWMAWKLGDDTPRVQGRVTLNPLAHLDPIGSLLIVFAGFGWGRPVQVNPYNFRNPGRDDMLVSLMGPVSNLAVAVGFAAALFLTTTVQHPYLDLVRPALLYGVLINVALMIFNLIPLHPLDGSHVMEALLPYEQRQAYQAFAVYSPFILLAIVFLFRGILSVPIQFVTRLVLLPFGLSQLL